MPTPAPTITSTESTEVISDPAETFVQSAALNQGGLQSWVPIGWKLQRDPCSTTTQEANFNALVRGHIMFLAGDNKMNNFFYAKKFSHIGMYDGITGGEKRVYEANQAPNAGARLLPIAGWQQNGDCIALADVNNVSDSAAQDALTWAEGFYGTNGSTPYNLNFVDKNTNSALYCSQLVWKVFMHINKDLDSNSNVYRDWLMTRIFLIASFPGYIAADIAANAMVAPDEIALHSTVVTYSEGTNLP